MTGNFVALMYRRLNRQLSAGDYIAWANAELARGCELPEIAEMASFALERDADAREVERYFLQCVQLLGIHMPEDAYQATRDYWAQTCDRMLDGSLGLDEGIALLYDIDDDQGYDLMQPWIDLSHHDGAVHWHDKQQQIVATDIARHGHDAYTWMLVRQFAAVCRAVPVARGGAAAAFSLRMALRGMRRRWRRVHRHATAHGALPRVRRHRQPEKHALPGQPAGLAVTASSRFRQSGRAARWRAACGARSHRTAPPAWATPA